VGQLGWLEVVGSTHDKHIIVSHDWSFILPAYTDPPDDDDDDGVVDKTIIVTWMKLEDWRTAMMIPDEFRRRDGSCMTGKLDVKFNYDDYICWLKWLCERSHDFSCVGTFDVDDDDEGSVKCRFCEATFTSNGWRTFHERKTHGNTDKNTILEVCKDLDIRSCLFCGLRNTHVDLLFQYRNRKLCRDRLTALWDAYSTYKLEHTDNSHDSKGDDKTASNVDADDEGEEDDEGKDPDDSAVPIWPVDDENVTHHCIRALSWVSKDDHTSLLRHYHSFSKVVVDSSESHDVESIQVDNLNIDADPESVVCPADSSQDETHSCKELKSSIKFHEKCHLLCWLWNQDLRPYATEMSARAVKRSVLLQKVDSWGRFTFALRVKALVAAARQYAEEN